MKEAIVLSIGNITINDYKQHFGRTQELHAMFKRELPEIIKSKCPSLDISNVDMYDLTGEYHNHNSGSKDSRLVIFVNGTQKGASEEILKLEKPENINGIENSFKEFLAPKGDGILISSKEGYPLAEWRSQSYELNILFDLFKEYNPSTLSIFEFIMEEFERLVWFPKTLEHSWVHSQIKDELTKRFTTQIKKQKEQYIREDKRTIENLTAKINDYKRGIKTASDTLAQKMRTVEVEEANLDKVSNSLIKDLDLIIQNPKIKDLHVKDGKFIVFTNPLNIYASNGKTYYGGNYRIELHPEQTDVRFFGDTTRKSYWSERDPHPHVDGRGGEACLGNVSSTIAELCSQMQIYALTMVCVDFLENANVSDSAGRNVVNWDEIDKEGKVTKKASRILKVECYECEEDYPRDAMHIVFGDIDDDDGSPVDERFVCSSCRDEYYNYNEDVEEYIHD